MATCIKYIGAFISLGVASVASADLITPGSCFMDAKGQLQIGYFQGTNFFTQFDDTQEQFSFLPSDTLLSSVQDHITGQPDYSGDGAASGQVLANYASDFFSLHLDSSADDHFTTIPDGNGKTWQHSAYGNAFDTFVFTVVDPVQVTINLSGTHDSQSQFVGQLLNQTTNEVLWLHTIDNGNSGGVSMTLAAGDYSLFGWLEALSREDSINRTSESHMDLTLSATPVPEPASFVVLLLGAGVMARRRRKASPAIC